MITRVERIDDHLLSFNKPLIEPTSQLSLDKDGTLIIAAGFEDRALGVLNLLASSHCKNFKTILIQYEPLLAENKIREITNLCQNMNSQITVFEYNRYNPAGGGEMLVQHLKDSRGLILFDISAVSRFLIVQFLVALGKSYHHFNHLRVLYTEACFYPPMESEVTQKMEQEDPYCISSSYHDYFISSGVYEVSFPPELSAVSSYGQPIRLVLFPSFNCDQLASLKGEIQPYFYDFIHGIPPSPDNAWRPQAIKKINHIDRISPPKQEEMDASTLDYRETLECLLKIYGAYTDKDRIVIAPTGSKMQSVAVGIFRTFLNDVQIVYPIPRKFTSPTRYTEGIKNIYTLDMEPFNTFFKRDFE